ncbi:hypothetical protein [Marinisporobacter balticus]
MCIATAIDRNNNIVMEMISKGSIKTNNLERLYVTSVICTDWHKRYIKFAQDNII